MVSRLSVAESESWGIDSMRCWSQWIISVREAVVRDVIVGGAGAEGVWTGEDWGAAGEHVVVDEGC